MRSDIELIEVPRRGQGDQPAASPAAKCNTSGRAQLSNAETLSNAQKQRSSTNVPSPKRSSRQVFSANVISEHDSDDEPFSFRNMSAAQRGDIEVGESSDEEISSVCDNSCKATPSRNLDLFGSQAGSCISLDNAMLRSADFPSSNASTQGERRSTTSSPSP